MQVWEGGGESVEVHAFLASLLLRVTPNKTVFDPSEERAPSPNLQGTVWIPEPLCTLWKGGK